MRPSPPLPNPLLQQHAREPKRRGRLVYHDGEEDDEAEGAGGAGGVGGAEGDAVGGGVDDEAEGCGEGFLGGVVVGGGRVGVGGGEVGEGVDVLRVVCGAGG